MLPELIEFVPATRMGIVRKVLSGLKIRAGCIFCSTRVFFYFDKTTTGNNTDDI
jgi:hypothetical protein